MVLRGKVEEISEYEANLKKANIEIQEYRRRLHDLEEANQMIAKYENKIAILSQEIERLNSVLEEFSSEKRKYLEEIERLNNTLRLKVEESSRFSASQQELISRLQMEEEKYNRLMQEFNGLKNTHSMLSSEYESSKKHLLEYEQR